MGNHAEHCQDVVFLIGAPRSAWDELDKQWMAARAEGSEGLNFLFPAELSQIHLNYGQGEGQVEIQGLEIGIYQRTGDLWTIVAHNFPIGKVFDQPREIAERICDYWEKLVSVRFFICCESR